MTSSLTPTQRRKIQALRNDLLYYAPNCLRIRSKSGAIEPLRLNAAQRILHQAIEGQLATIGRVRVIGLKGRQQGFSTYIQGRNYWKVTQRRGVRAFILTHEDEATRNLYEMAQRFHELAPASVKPPARVDSARELRFDGLDSGYRVGTAGSRGVGRSATLQYFHGSEVAFWPHAETHLAGVLQAVPNEPGTEAVLESTANGVGGVFHTLWKDAEAGIGDYLPVFLPWFLQAEYRRDATGFEPDGEELRLAARYGLDFEQLAWRRAKIAELKSLQLFRQEYPCEAEEAFIFSGRPVFLAAPLEAAEAECFNPAYRATLAAGGLTKREDGELRVWDDPQPGRRYVIGADVAEGLARGDFSCADVLRVPDGAQVAQWHGHIDPDRYADVLAWLGKHYNAALIGVERNNHGLTTLTGLRNGGYAHLYAQQDLEHRAEGKESRRVGWLTTAKSKTKIIDQLAAEVRDGESGIVCRETVREMATFVVHEDGHQGAKAGCYDDRVMSRAIAGEMLRIAPRPRPLPAADESQGPADPVGGY